MTRKIERLVIHGADTPDGSTRYTIQDVIDWHTNPRAPDGVKPDPKLHGCGWDNAAYRWVIETSGVIEEGHAWNEIGNHVKGLNSTSEGICLMGRGRYTPEQWDSLRRLLIARLDAHSLSPAQIFGHYQLDKHNDPPKTCPCFDVPLYLAHGLVPQADNIYTGDLHG